MKKLILLILLLALPIYGAFFTHTEAETNNIDSVSPDWKDWTWEWNGMDNQDVDLTFINDSGAIDMDTYIHAVRVSDRFGTIYINLVDSNMTASTSNLTFSITPTNIPPAGDYWMEVRCWEGATTNLARSLAKGRIHVSHSLYEDTNTFTFPVSPTNLYSYLSITQAAQTYLQLDSDVAMSDDLNAGGYYITNTLGIWFGTNGYLRIGSGNTQLVFITPALTTNIIVSDIHN
jgi:hypothetical protein